MSTKKKIILGLLIILAMIAIVLVNPKFTDTAGSKALTDPVGNARANITYNIAIQIDKTAVKLSNSLDKPAYAMYDTTVTFEQEAIIQILPLSGFELYKVDTYTYKLQSFPWQKQACIHVSRQVGKLGTVTKGEC